MQFTEFTDPDSQITYQYSEFSIANTEFVINFCSDIDAVSIFSLLGEDVASYLKLYSTCTVKFMAKEHLENSALNLNLYAPAPNHHFRRKEIIALQK